MAAMSSARPGSGLRGVAATPAGSLVAFHALGALRIVAALLFLEHGLMKLAHFPVAQPGAPDPLPLLLQLAGWIEVVGGGLLLVGWQTRAVAFICAGEMAAAYFIAHASRAAWPAANGGDAAILFCFIFLYFAAAGSGAVSIDERRSWRRSGSLTGPPSTGSLK